MTRPPAQSFLETMMDFSFSSFITIRIIKFLYILSLVAVVLWALAIMVGGFMSGGIRGIFAGIVLGPLALVVGALLARVYMELLIVAFRIADNTSRIVEIEERKVAR